MSIEQETLDISAEQIPIEKFYDFGGTTFLLKFIENKKFEFFTVNIFDSTGVALLYSNKLVYGVNIIDSVLAPFQDSIIPLNINVLKGETTDDKVVDDITLGNTVKLFTDLTEV